MIVRLIAALALLICAATGARAAAPGGTFIDLPEVPSRHVAPMHVTIWLPPGYEAGRRRYQVIYMNDGQNLFFPEKSGMNKVWAADRSVMRLVAAKRIEPAIIVGIWSPGKDRARTYGPAKLYAALPPDAAALAEGFMAGPNQSDAYLRFLVSELKPMVDRRYRTLADRAHTTIVGSSMGGLISLYAIAEYPKVFGQAGCLSTHWPLVDPDKVGPARQDVMAVWARYLEDRLGRPAGRRLWFDHGDQTLDHFYGPWQAKIDDGMERLGWRRGRDFESRVYPGAAHEENAWAARLDDVLGWLLRPRGQPGPVQGQR